MSDYGNMLVQARKHKRVSIERCARDLRVRRDILEYIEMGDFRNLPSAGHAKNLVFAYSKYLGLNPASVTEVFVEERDEYMRTNSRSAGNMGGPILNMERRGVSRSSINHYDDYEPHNLRMRANSTEAASYRSGSSDYRSNTMYEGAKGRREMGRVDSRSTVDYSARANHNLPREHSMRAPSMNRSGDTRYATTGSSSARRPYENNAGLRSGANGIGNVTFGSSRSYQRVAHSNSGKSTVSFQNSPSFNSNSDLLSKLPFFAAGLVILILIVVILVLLLSPKPTTDTSSEYISVTGADSSEISSSDVQEDPQTAPAPVLTPPVSAKVEYSNTGSGDVWVEVYLDGASSPDVAKLLPVGAKESYDVTGTLEFVATIPDYITLTVDGNPVELVAGNGSYSYTVDFAEILEAWNLKYKPAPQGSAGSVSAIDALDDSLGVTGGEGTAQTGSQSSAQPTAQTGSQSSAQPTAQTGSQSSASSSTQASSNSASAIPDNG